MSLPMLFSGGADCGPSNPLQSLAKRFDQDKGIQQDQFGASGPSSSRDTFRTQGTSGPDAEAARFFSSTPAVAKSSTPGLSTVFDVSAMRAALSLPSSMQTQQLQPPGMVATGWAADFINMNTDQRQKQHQMPSVAGSVHGTMDAHTGVAHSPPPLMQNWAPMGVGMRGFVPQIHVHQQQPQASTSRLNDQISWDKEFTAQEQHLTSSSVIGQTQHQHQQPETPTKPHFEGDELARTAGMLIESLKHETNPKFQNSQFMGLMKQLRDGEVVVDGNQMIENDDRMMNSSQINLGVNSKGKGKERAFVGPPLELGDPIMESDMFRVSHNHNSPQQQAQRGKEDQDANDAYFKAENVDYAQFWENFDQRIAPASTITTTTQGAEWHTLQEDWDRFEATSSGIRQLNNYQFQDSNPYLLGDSSKTRHHAMHSGMSSVLQSVLELEAAVQRDMTNARTWYDLGVKQQENEREQKALQALERAVELDPTHLPSWLALAISYTNDNNRQSTYGAVEEWVKRNERYVNNVPYNASSGPGATKTMTLNERYSRLVDQLIAMARSDTTGEIDADTQIALAVLLNTNEDYQRAQDCFKTALAIRPDDWSLYNRVGATLANSGHAAEALDYYYKALELNPGYIRARFNLGISCINLRRYEEAAQYILDALVLQDSDGAKDSAGGRGVTSMTLWESMKTTCLQMQRTDLASLCDARNLEQFRARFQGL